MPPAAAVRGLPSLPPGAAAAVRQRAAQSRRQVRLGGRESRSAAGRHPECSVAAQTVRKAPGEAAGRAQPLACAGRQPRRPARLRAGAIPGRGPVAGAASRAAALGLPLPALAALRLPADRLLPAPPTPHAAHHLPHPLPPPDNPPPHPLPPPPLPPP